MERKAVSGIMLTILLAGILTLAFNVVSLSASLPVHNIDTGLDYATIQEAIDAPETLNGHTILVEAGTYYEHLTVYKSLMLVGEDPATTIIDGSGSGDIIAIAGTNGISINGFTIQNGYRGIDLYTSSDNTIYNNTISSNSNIGIHISWYSDRNNVTGNTVTSSGYKGVGVTYSSDNVLRRNNISNNNANLMVSGFYTNDIDTSNLVDGKPVYYLTGQNNLVIDPSTFPNIGYLVVINSKNITVRDLNLTRNGSGVLFVNVTDSIIEHVNATSNIYGIIMEDTSNNSILRNTMVDNRFFGISLRRSNDNAVTANDISRNSVGIRLQSAEGNTLICNTISHSHGKYIVNATGIEVYFSPNNRIFHNHFINNSLQAYVRESSANLWDDGYPSGGNYWSDYSGVDLYSGPYQNETGSDGIGDSPYVISGSVGNQDNYPLLSLFDIAITNTTFSKNIVGTGYPLTINCRSKNLGLYTETFNITVYANSTLIGTEEVTLDSKYSTFTLFTWHTTEFEKGNYTINVYATPIPGELKTDDNNYTGDTVKVTLAGDVNGDSYVDIFDLSIVGQAYGSFSGDPEYNPYADITEDGLVDARDLAVVTIHYGETDP